MSFPLYEMSQGGFDGALLLFDLEPGAVGELLDAGAERVSNKLDLIALQ